MEFIVHFVSKMTINTFITITRACFNKPFQALNTLMTHEITVSSATTLNNVVITFY